ncbi:hypothetical protein [Symbiobacterium terraclitae]|uniref:hypothetical protein n=1 Tax=Symbiobacterium terraclitae TaxID=557451 RepID=UPI0035B507A8
MQTVAYLLLALAVIGALAYALYQVNARQNRLMAELTRLERLTAEVAMSAEALLDEVDRRAQRLSQLAAELEERAAAQVRKQDQAQADAPAPAPEQVPAQPTAAEPPAVGQKPKRQRRPRGGARATPSEAQDQSGSQAKPAGQARSNSPAAKPTQEPSASDRYADLRQAVWRLADEGRDAVEIAATLGVPRGEVMLLLNLRGKKGPR